MECYLDNSATTRCDTEVADLMREVLCENFGNPSSLHHLGVVGESYLKEARQTIAKTLKVNDKEIYFTSGGTESNNLAIIGTAMANRRAGMHVITTKIEHPSVANPFAYLEEQGFSVDYLSVNSFGEISLEELSEKMTEETILVSIMHVNNEIGAVEPIEEAAKIIHEKNPACLFHVDAIQSFGKYRIYPKRMGIDLLSVSGHKIHGPKGSGFLFVKEKTKIRPVLLGGGQESGLRSGTENVAAIAGLGLATTKIYEDFEEHIALLRSFKEKLIARLAKIDGVSVNGRTDAYSAPHIVSVSVKGVRSEVLLHALEDRGIYVSAGSACSSNKPSVSKTLLAISLDHDLLDSTVRFSFSIHTTMEEIDDAADAMEELVPMLARFTRH